MYTMYAMWSAPADEAAFEEYYLGTHVPKAAALPGLTSIVSTRTADGYLGVESPYFRVAELTFPDKAAYEATQTTPEWTRVTECTAHICETFGVTVAVLSGDVDEAEPTHGR